MEEQIKLLLSEIDELNKQIKELTCENERLARELEFASMTIQKLNVQQLLIDLR